MSSVGFETAIPAIERLQTHAWAHGQRDRHIMLHGDDFHIVYKNSNHVSSPWHTLTLSSDYFLLTQQERTVSKLYWNHETAYFLVIWWAYVYTPSANISIIQRSVT